MDESLISTVVLLGKWVSTREVLMVEKWYYDGDSDLELFRAPTTSRESRSQSKTYLERKTPGLERWPNPCSGWTGCLSFSDTVL